MAKAKEKVAITHCDIMGNDIPIGAYVASNYHNGLAIFKVVKLSAKMVQVEKLGSKASAWRPNNYTNRYPYDLVLLDQEAVVFHILRKSD